MFFFHFHAVLGEKLRPIFIMANNNITTKGIKYNNIIGNEIVIHLPNYFFYNINNNNNSGPLRTAMHFTCELYIYYVRRP